MVTIPRHLRYRLLSRLALLLFCLTPLLQAQDLLISEVMASNDTTLADEDGAYPDWLEIHNRTGSIVDLTGWYLTDDNAEPTKWLFPNGQQINPGAYLIVFASDKNRRVAGSELHTNFKLSSSGEYLALVKPDGVTIEHDYAPELPLLETDQSYGVDVSTPSIRGVFSSPTPGASNADLTLAPPSFNLESQFFQTTSVSLEMSAAPGMEIYYITQTLSGYHTRNVTNLDTAYTGPITVSSSTVFKAITYDPNTFTYSQPVYVALGKLNASMQNFSSDIPFFVIDTFGEDWMLSQQLALTAVYDVDPQTGRSSVNNAPDYMGLSGIKIRGSSTATHNKKQWGLETWKNNTDDTKVSILGFEKESDYVLEAPYEIDRAMLRVPFIFELGRQLGVEVSEDRFVEVFANFEGGDMDGTIQAWDGSNEDGVDYRGVYILKHNTRPGWLDLKDPLPVAERPSVTTTSPVDDFDSFIFAFDRTDPDDINHSSNYYSDSGPARYVQHWPKADDLPAGPDNYMQTFLTAMEDAMHGPDFADPELGWRQYIDEDSVINYHLIHLIAMEIDAYRFSFFAHKDRGEKLKFGPLWDYDRAMDSTVNNDDPHDVTGYFFDAWHGNTPIWVYPFFSDAEFSKNWIDRFGQLRKTVLSDAGIDAIIDAHAAELQEAHERNYIRWPEDEGAAHNQTLVPGEASIAPTWEGQVEHLRAWLKAHIQFIEDNLIQVVEFNLADQIVPQGHNSTTLSFTTSPFNSGNAKIYYTLDGSDPRPQGNHLFYNYASKMASRPAPTYDSSVGTADGPPAGNAIEYTGQPITINKSTVIRARVYDPDWRRTSDGWRWPNDQDSRRLSDWSPLQELRLGVVESVPELLITEIMYHAPDEVEGDATKGKRFEFVEIKNPGVGTVDLSAFELEGDINYTFETGTTLSPGAHLVVVKDLSEFANKYPAFSGTVLGPYRENLDNDGGEIRLVDPADLLITRVDFNDAAPWPQGADGLGFSLVPLDPNSNPNPSDAANWRSSANIGGSPGADDPNAGLVSPVYINEVLTHTDLPLRDSIEIYNPNSSTVDISGWFLTDDKDEPKKYKLPSTSIPANSFHVLDENDFGSAFLLSELGEEIYLYSADGSENLTGHVHGFKFEALDNGSALGAYETSSLNNNDIHYTTLESRTLGSANALPQVGPLVLSEIHYHPADGGDEFVEIANISNNTVQLYDPANPSNTWQLSGYGFTFPTGVTLDPGAVLIVTDADPVTFRNAYAVPAHVAIYQTDGGLKNSGELLRLRRPGQPEAVWPYAVPYYTVDAVDYLDEAPWPAQADGVGMSLERINSASYGNDPINWEASTQLHGTPGIGGTPPTTPIITASTTSLSPSGFATFSIDAGTVEIFNSGINTLNYTISESSSWLSVSPTAGISTGISDKQSHTVSYDTSGLAAGQHVTSITIHDGNAINAPYTLTVTLTLDPAPTPPAAPTGLTANADGAFGMDLSWTDNASDEAGFYIERKPTGGSWTQIADLAQSDATSFSDSGLQALTSYAYRIRAYNIAGTSAYSNEVTASTTDNLTVLDIPITIATDDAEENLSSGAVNVSSSDLELSYDGGNAQLVGLRFANVAITPGAQIHAAYITFTVKDSVTGSDSVIIRAEDNDSAAAILATTVNLSTRTLTTAQAHWTLGNWSTGQPVQTADLSAIIQEVVDRSGWVSGNSLFFALSGASGTHNAFSANGGTAPSLHIEFAEMAPNTGYAAWAGTNILNGGPSLFDSDADQDGIPNGIEYALGLDPDDGLIGTLPSIHYDGSRLSIRFQLPASIPTDLQYIIEGSQTPDFASAQEIARLDAGSSTWSGSATPSSVSGGELIQVDDSSDLQSGQNRFLRLRVAIP